MKLLRWHQLISINLFWLGLNIRNNAVGAILLPYLIDVFVQPDIKNTALGAARTASLVVAMLAQPAMGLLSDRNTSRFGRRRPFLVVGVLLDLLCLAAVGLSWNYPSLLAAVLLQQLCANISHGALQGLIPDLVPEQQRGLAAGMKSIFELLPIIVVGFTIARLVSGGQLTWAIVATGAALVILMLLTVMWVKEEPLQEKPNIPFWPVMLRVFGMLGGILSGAAAGIAGGALAGGVVWLAAWPVWGAQAAQIAGFSVAGLTAMTLAVWVGVNMGVTMTLGKQAGEQTILQRILGGQGSFTWWVKNRLFFLAAITSIQGFTPFFLMYAFKVERDTAAGMTGSLMIMVGLFTLATALPGGWLADRFGHRRVIAISGVLAAVGAGVLLTAVWAPSMAILYAAGAVLGLATGLFMTANWALGTNLVPRAEAGRYLGISNLAGAGAGMVGSGLGGPIADNLNRITPGLGYFILFSCYAILFLFSAVALRGVQAAAPQRAADAAALPAD